MEKLRTLSDPASESMNLRSYFDLRKENVAAFVFLPFFAVDSGLDCVNMFDKQINKDYSNFNEQICWHYIMHNDLLSLHKEAEENHKSFNYVYIIMVENKLSIQEAADRTVSDLNKCDEMLVKYSNNLKKLNNEAINQYTMKAISSVRGGLYWHTICNRYKNAEFKFFDPDDNIMIN